MPSDKTRRLTYGVNILSLIRMVKAKPCLWQKSSQTFYEPSERSKAWLDICCQFDPSFPKMEESEKIKMMHFVRGKWQNTRDAFMKSKNKMCSQKYRYHNQLTFLLKNVEAEEKQSPDSSTLQEKTLQRSHSTANHVKLSFMPATFYRRNESINKENHGASGASGASSAPRIPSRKGSTRQEEFMDFAETRAEYGTEDYWVSTVHRNSSLDEDEAFFSSILSSIRTLPEGDKLDFRTGVLSTLRDIKRRSKTT